MKNKLQFNLKLEKFDMRKIGNDACVVVLGKRASGKSFLVKDLLYNKQHIPVGTIISGTEESTGFFSTILPRKFIHNKYDEEIINNVLKRQKILNKKIMKDKQMYGKSLVNPSAFVLMDDCLFDSAWSKSVNIRSIFMNGRHYKIFYILTMQYPLGIPPDLRTNIDYVFIFRENIVSNRERIFKQFAGMFPNFNVFCQVMNSCTENYECLVIDNTSKSNKLEDCCFWYKADTHPPFRLGCPEMWKDNEVDEKEEDEDNAYDITTAQNKKNGLHDLNKNKITVKVLKNL
jgi:hypothetical protein